MTTETPANGPPCSLVTVPVTVFTCAIACAVHRKSPTSTMTSFVFIARCTGCWWTERDPGARVERADDGARMCIRDGAWGPSRADGACDERALVTPVTEPRQSGYISARTIRCKGIVNAAARCRLESLDTRRRAAPGTCDDASDRSRSAASRAESAPSLPRSSLSVAYRSAG